jgi:ABC-type phosphate transport system substrate-binding protein
MKNLILFGLLGLVAAQAQAGAVVVGKDSPLGTMEAEEVKKIFLGREPQLNGQNVTVVYQKESAIRTDFETKVLGKTGADLSGYWSKLIFTGKAQAPDEATGDAGVKAKVASSPGAIGYVSDGAVDASVKVLFKY